VKRPYYVIVLAVLLGVVSWVIDVFFRSVVFPDHTFFELLLSPEIDLLWKV